MGPSILSNRQMPYIKMECNMRFKYEEGPYRDELVELGAKAREYLDEALELTSRILKALKSGSALWMSDGTVIIKVSKRYSDLQHNQLELAATQLFNYALASLREEYGDFRVVLESEPDEV